MLHDDAAAPTPASPIGAIAMAPAVPAAALPHTESVAGPAVLDLGCTAAATCEPAVLKCTAIHVRLGGISKRNIVVKADGNSGR